MQSSRIRSYVIVQRVRVRDCKSSSIWSGDLLILILAGSLTHDLAKAERPSIGYRTVSRSTSISKWCTIALVIAMNSGRLVRIDWGLRSSAQEANGDDIRYLGGPSHADSRRGADSRRKHRCNRGGLKDVNQHRVQGGAA